MLVAFVPRWSALLHERRVANGVRLDGRRDKAGDNVIKAVLDLSLIRHDRWQRGEWSHESVNRDPKRAISLHRLE
jgi:hypothetical protein